MGHPCLSRAAGAGLTYTVSSSGCLRGAGDEPDEQIFSTPPFICIEILSPEDRLSAMQKRVGDFRAMGVPYVWILDPRTRHGWRVMDEGLLAVAELRTSNPEIVVPLAALFE